MDKKRFEKQIRFIVEIDKLKTIYRQSVLIEDNTRYENDAEHSWHLAMTAILLLEYSKDANKLDMLRTIKMLLIHDIIEIDAGDTYCYDKEANRDKAEREKRAADRIFSLLPDDQAKEFFDLWNEFENQKTPEAKFAAVIDRFQPLLSIYYSQGYTWKEHGITSDQEIERNKIIQEGMPELWEYVEDIIRDSVENGFLRE
jgi:putative hydrolase of HD superfamily